MAYLHITSLFCTINTETIDMIMDLPFVAVTEQMFLVTVFLFRWGYS
jgi:hypothetical protein